MDLIRAFRRHGFSRAEAQAITAGLPQVFEVTDLLIPAGTDWSAESGHVLGTVTFDSTYSPIARFFIQLGDVLPVGNEIGIVYSDDPGQAYDSYEDGAVITDQSQAVSKFYPDQEDLTGIPGENFSFSVSIVTSGPTTADIHIVRARAAFLIL